MDDPDARDDAAALPPPLYGVGDVVWCVRNGNNGRWPSKVNEVFLPIGNPPRYVYCIEWLGTASDDVFTDKCDVFQSDLLKFSAKQPQEIRNTDNIAYSAKYRTQYSAAVAEAQALVKQYDAANQAKVESIVCAVCMTTPPEQDCNLLLCDGRCERGFHRECLGLAAMPPPEAEFKCMQCTRMLAGGISDGGGGSTSPAPAIQPAVHAAAANLAAGGAGSSSADASTAKPPSVRVRFAIAVAEDGSVGVAIRARRHLRFNSAGMVTHTQGYELHLANPPNSTGYVGVLPTGSNFTAYWCREKLGTFTDKVQAALAYAKRRQSGVADPASVGTNLEEDAAVQGERNFERTKALQQERGWLLDAAEDGEKAGRAGWAARRAPERRMQEERDIAAAMQASLSASVPSVVEDCEEEEAAAGEDGGDGAPLPTPVETQPANKKQKAAPAASLELPPPLASNRTRPYVQTGAAAEVEEVAQVAAQEMAAQEEAVTTGGSKRSRGSSSRPSGSPRKKVRVAAAQGKEAAATASPAGSVSSSARDSATGVVAGPAMVAKVARAARAARSSAARANARAEAARAATLPGAGSSEDPHLLSDDDDVEAAPTRHMPVAEAVEEEAAAGEENAGVAAAPMEEEEEEEIEADDMVEADRGQEHWGAFAEEVAEELPADQLVDGPAAAKPTSHAGVDLYMSANSISGYLGVRLSKSMQRPHVAKYGSTHLGAYATAVEAAFAYALHRMKVEAAAAAPVDEDASEEAGEDAAGEEIEEVAATRHSPAAGSSGGAGPSSSDDDGTSPLPERIKLDDVSIEIYGGPLPEDLVRDHAQPTPIKGIPPSDLKQARQLLQSHFCRQCSSYNRILIDALLERKLPQGESREQPANFNKVKGSGGGMVNSPSCEELQDVCVGLARCNGDVVGVVCFSLVRANRRSKAYCAAEIILFRVGRPDSWNPNLTVEGQGIGTRMFTEVQEFVVKQARANILVVLSADPASANDNWWIRRLESRGIKWQEAKTQRELVSAINVSSAHLPQAFWVPWPMDGDDARSGDEIVALTVTCAEIKRIVQLEERQRVQKMPLRKLRMAELGAYSGNLTMAFLEYGWQAFAYERNLRAPVFSTFAAAGKSAFVKACDFYTELKSLGGYDYVHLSPNCTSNSQLAQSIHRRNEENDFDGESIEAEEYNNTLSHSMDMLAAATLSNSAFAFTFEQPKGIARNNIDIHRRFEKEGSNSAYSLALLHAPTTALLASYSHPAAPYLACSCLYALHILLVQTRQQGVQAD